MIDNVMLLLKGTLSGRSASELIQQCHPLGLFKVREKPAASAEAWRHFKLSDKKAGCDFMEQESTMRSIPTFEATPKGYADLYQTVLIDTPVGTRPSHACQAIRRRVMYAGGCAWCNRWLACTVHAGLSRPVLLAVPDRQQ